MICGGKCVEVLEACDCLDRAMLVVLKFRYAVESWEKKEARFEPLEKNSSH